MIWIFAILSAAAIAVSISIDAFAVSFAYGCKKIKIPMSAALLISCICTAIIGVSFLFGTLLQQHIPYGMAAAISFAILFMIGLLKLFDSITKSLIRRHVHFDKEVKLSVFNLKLAMRLYADPEAADEDKSKSLCAKEAAVLAISLSLDGLAVGLSAALIGINPLILLTLTLITGYCALLFGGWLGNKAAGKLPFNISWLAGVMLIGLAFAQLV